MSGEANSTPHRVEVTVTADRRTVEALCLEVRRLAKSLGVDVSDLQVRATAAAPVAGEAAASE